MNADVESTSQDRQQLMVRLLDAVKQCQIRFGGKTELATESDSRVCVLCSAWESVLQHGMKHNNRAMSTLKQFTEVTGLSRFGTGLMDDIKNLETEPAFWVFTKEHMSVHEHKRYTILRHISTDAGRGRAWLRSALNEHSLERYMHVMSNSIWLSQFYEDWAFLRDAEKSAVLPDMAAGLGSILFAINIDNSDLNAIKPATGLDNLLSRPTPPTSKPVAGDDDPPPVVSTAGSPPAEKKGTRRRKKKPAKIVTFEYDDVGSSSYSASPASTLVSPTGTDNQTSPTRSTMSDHVSPTRPVGSDNPMTPSPPNTSATNGANSDINVSCSVAITSASSESFNGLVSTDSFRSNGLTESSSTSVLESSPVLRRNTQNEETRLADRTAGNDAERFSFPTLNVSTARSSVIDIPRSLSRVKVEAGATTFPRSSAAFNDSRVPGRVEVLSKSLIRTDSASSNLSVDSNSEAPSSVFRSESDACLTPLNCDGKPIELDATAGSIDGDNQSGSYGSYDSREMHDFNETPQRSVIGVTEVQDRLDRHVDRTSRSRLADSDSTRNGVTTTSLTDGLSKDELKDAVVAMMLRREEVEDQNRRLHAAFEVEMVTCAGLRQEIVEMQRLDAMQRDADGERIKNLTRENDLLKHQLRKYVGAVQMLRREGAKPDDFPGIHLDALQPAIPAAPDIIDYSAQASEYERKLIQVAEMHGELMEFNDLLQKQLMARETQLKHLTDELESLRGPLPRAVAPAADDVISIASADRNHDNLSSRPLINIWIPSAFLRGTSTDGFHVYQVYVRIRNEEWNIYRRYAEFYDLRTRLRKNYPIVTTFDFPPKKAFGKKDPKIVEVRRKTLETFLRRIVTLLTQELNVLVENPCRNTLTNVLPFFGDVPAVDKNKRKNKKSRGRTSSESGPTESTSANTSTHHYMGL